MVDTSEDPSLVSGLEALHVSVEPLSVTIVSEKTIPSLELTAAPDAESVIEDINDDKEDDQLTVPVENGTYKKDNGNVLLRLIVEALVLALLQLLRPLFLLGLHR
ncbi:hypothetical protein B0H11DRAFT_2262679 [Mycena galericulata]|nr:hypothetical protein B0H11DRAFT_2262679 [Mycena galericulata]